MDELKEPQKRRGWSPHTRIAPVISTPCSKSQALRVLLAASLAEGETRIRDLSCAEDVTAALANLEGLGAELEHQAKEGVWRVRRGASLDSGFRSLQAGESGTLARLLTAIAAFALPPQTLSKVEVRGTLRHRTSSPLLSALRSAGVQLHAESREGSWPLELRSVPAPPSLELQSPTSSQEVSALLLALCASGEQHTLHVVGPIPSQPYLELTIRTLEQFGASVRRSDAETFHASGPLRAPAAPLELEPDASAAAVALAAACLTDGRTEVHGFGRAPLQGDVAIVEALTAFGCRAGLDEGRLWAEGRPSHGARLDLRRTPDLAPVLAAVAAAVALRGGAEASSRLEGLGTLEGKESARVTVLAGALEALGLRVCASNETLELAPGTPTRVPLVLDPRGDHRMAFAFALLGLVRPGITVSDPGCVSKSWPDFWEACVEPPHPENRDPA